MVRSRFDITKWRVAGIGVAVVATVLSGCANVGQQNAQTGATVPASGVSVGSSATASSGSAVSATTTIATSQAAAPIAPQIYKVRRGDTLSRIAQNHGCSVADLQTWNGLKRSARLKTGQTLKVSSPDATAVASANDANGSHATAPTTTENTSASADQTDPALARQVAAQAARHANGVALTWPAQGKVVESFQPGETRGIEISGKSGDPILAAADGKVMYAGTGLNEYGSLIIVQHNKDFLTTYAHNRRLLVKTGDIVRQGQQIAEMGDENNSRVAVLFEVRRDGKPVDPMPYLPRRG
ncbi:peptidoglycan DD-metalloendopeptidase family protein [Paraburkholderia flava]|uniref:peptidoglycan DD-metalloendopeptidase family protein n=1 Tax=Paraburkholderia flava TaxID=2547393 RepID=UPI00197DBD33|nr:peptidoglycan DD-metalloendopeptidase family protein [Paraburkholderia flava]